MATSMSSQRTTPFPNPVSKEGRRDVRGGGAFFLMRRVPMDLGMGVELAITTMVLPDVVVTTPGLPDVRPI